MSAKPSSMKPPTASPKALVDQYFLDTRHKIIEIAAFLDRIERSREQQGDSGDPLAADDFRLAAMRDALKILTSDRAGKAKAIQLVFSDPTVEALDSAAGMKGATGAWKKP